MKSPNEKSEKPLSKGMQKIKAFQERLAAHWAAGNKPVDPYREQVERAMKELRARKSDEVAASPKPSRKATKT